MRLGAGFFLANTVEELEPLCEKLDCYGLSAIQGPPDMGDWHEGKWHTYGHHARDLGLVIGEVGMWENLMTGEPALREGRIGVVRRLLLAAEHMGCRSVVVLAGSHHPSDRALAPHPDNYTAAYRAELRETILRILDGLAIEKTRLIIEPWHNTFFYQPEDIRSFLDEVDHPYVGLHLDQMNMITQQTLFKTTELIERTFRLLSDRIVSVHLKDLRCDHRHMFLKYDECAIGDGVMDYGAYLRALGGLHPDMPCYLEHMSEERDYVMSIARLHWLARNEGLRFLPRAAAGP
jgi:sugar phosphate isomerase/epimerase